MESHVSVFNFEICHRFVFCLFWQWRPAHRGNIFTNSVVNVVFSLYTQYQLDFIQPTLIHQ